MSNKTESVAEQLDVRKEAILKDFWAMHAREVRTTEAHIDRLRKEQANTPTSGTPVSENVPEQTGHQAKLL